MCHKSQRPEVMWELHNKMGLYRGLELKCPHAEAFHMLGTKTTFDDLFDDVHFHGPSGGLNPMNLPCR